MIGLPSLRNMLRIVTSAVVFLSAWTAQAQNNAGTPCSETVVRRSFRNLSRAEQEQFLIAFNDMNRDGIVGELQLMHASMLAQGHGNEFFLIAHRWFLWHTEKRLRQYGFPFIPTLDSCENFDSFWEGNEWWDLLGGSNGCIHDRSALLEDFYVVDNNGNTGQCTSRAADGAALCNCVTIQELIADVPSFADFSRNIETTCHAYFHNSCGGAMRGPRTSAADPAFFLHHSDVDKWLATWQAFEPSRVREMGEQFLSQSSGLWSDFTVEQLMDHAGTLCYTYPEVQGFTSGAEQEVVTEEPENEEDVANPDEQQAEASQDDAVAEEEEQAETVDQAQQIAENTEEDGEKAGDTDEQQSDGMPDDVAAEEADQVEPVEEPQEVPQNTEESGEEASNTEGQQPDETPGDAVAEEEEQAETADQPRGIPEDGAESAEEAHNSDEEQLDSAPNGVAVDGGQQAEPVDEPQEVPENTDDSGEEGNNNDEQQPDEAPDEVAAKEGEQVETADESQEAPENPDQEEQDGIPGAGQSEERTGNAVEDEQQPGAADGPPGAPGTAKEGEQATDKLEDMQKVEGPGTAARSGTGNNPEEGSSNAGDACEEVSGGEEESSTESVVEGQDEIEGNELQEDDCCEQWCPDEEHPSAGDDHGSLARSDANKPSPSNSTGRPTIHIPERQLKPGVKLAMPSPLPADFIRDFNLDPRAVEMSRKREWQVIKRSRKFAGWKWKKWVFG